MTRAHTDTTFAQGDVTPEQWGARIMWARVSGLGLACVGVFFGVALTLDRRPSDCPPGTSFPRGTTDFECFAHPHAPVGVTLAIVSVLLGILIYLTSIAARALVTEPRAN